MGYKNDNYRGVCAKNKRLITHAIYSNIRCFAGVKQIILGACLVDAGILERRRLQLVLFKKEGALAPFVIMHWRRPGQTEAHKFPAWLS